MGEDSTEPLDDSVRQLIAIVQSMDARVQNMDARMTSLEAKVDERLYDTRPIWERVLAEIAELRTGQEQLKAAQEEMRAEIAELRAEHKELRTTTWEGFHKVERQLMFLNKDFLDRRAEVNHLEDRIEKLESERA